MKKYVIGLIIVIVVIGIFFTIYILRYQKLIAEGSVLADDHCLIVNPLIIERKNKYLDSMKVLQASGSAEDYWKETEQYISISKDYLSAEDKWLGKQKQYIDRWDFNLLIPHQTKEAAKYQFKGRVADRNSTDALIKLFEEKDPDKQKILSEEVVGETLKSKKAEEEYNKIWNLPRTFDIRNYFTKVPPSKCPDKNFDIPDVQDFFNPSKPIINSPLS